MAGIPSWIWLAVGLLIAITSWYVELTLFFWLGWLMIIVGAAKFVIAFTSREKESAQEKSTVNHLMPQQHKEHYGRCSCGNMVFSTQQYCHVCGKRLR